MSPVGRAAVIYTGARFGLFLIFSMLIWSLAGMAGYAINGFLLLMLGLLFSSIVGYFVLAGQRDAFARAIAERQREPEGPEL